MPAPAVTGTGAPAGTVPTFVVPGCRVRASRPAVSRYDAVVAPSGPWPPDPAVVSLASEPSGPKWKLWVVVTGAGVEPMVVGPVPPSLTSPLTRVSGPVPP